jgi:hypothetical protein
MISIRAVSHQIISGRLTHRSTRAPAGKAMSANAAVAAEVSRPTWNVDAPSATTAVSGKASWVIAEPSSLTDCPAHRNRKFRCRHSVPAGAVRASVSGSGGRCTALLCPARACLSNRLGNHDDVTSQWPGPR